VNHPIESDAAQNVSRVLREKLVVDLRRDARFVLGFRRNKASLLE